MLRLARSRHRRRARLGQTNVPTMVRVEGEIPLSADELAILVRAIEDHRGAGTGVGEVDARYVSALIATESGFQRDAASCASRRRPCPPGAIIARGLMQITTPALIEYNEAASHPAAGFRPGTPVTAEQLFDIEPNVRVGLFLLRSIVLRLQVAGLPPDWNDPSYVEVVTHAYNAGSFGVPRVVRHLIRNGRRPTLTEIALSAPLVLGPNVRLVGNPDRIFYAQHVARVAFGEEAVTVGPRRPADREGERAGAPRRPRERPIVEASAASPFSGVGGLLLVGFGGLVLYSLSQPRRRRRR